MDASVYAWAYSTPSFMNVSHLEPLVDEDVQTTLEELFSNPQPSTTDDEDVTGIEWRAGPPAGDSRETAHCTHDLLRFV